MRRTAMLVLVIAAVLTSCGSETEEDDTDAAEDQTAVRSDPPDASPRSPDPTPRPGTVVKTAPSDYGTMLFDKSGQAIYLFDKETSERPRCYRDCAEAWPPVLTEGEPRAADRAKQRLLGTTERRDGTTQITYAGHPLYFYAHEGKNEVLCHDVTEYGGVWLVVQPDGDAAG